MLTFNAERPRMKKVSHRPPPGNSLNEIVYWPPDQLDQLLARVVELRAAGVSKDDAAREAFRVLRQALVRPAA